MRRLHTEELGGRVAGDSLGHLEGVDVGLAIDKRYLPMSLGLGIVSCRTVDETCVDACAYLTVGIGTEEDMVAVDGVGGVEVVETFGHTRRTAQLETHGLVGIGHHGLRAVGLAVSEVAP